MSDWSPHVDRLSTRVGQTIRHGIVTNVVNETGTIARVQVSLSDIEVYDSIPFIQSYGFASSPVVGAACMLVSSSGDMSQAYATASHDARHRPLNMGPGELTIHDDKGNSIYLSNTGDGIRVTASTKVTVIAPDVEIRATGTITLEAPQVHATGTITVDGDVVASGKSLVHHIHRDSRGGNTTPPL